MRRYLWILLPFLIVWGCEDLEDTYSDYAGDGPIRYLTNCDSITLTNSWESVIIRWQNNADPIADSVKITWILDDFRGDTLLSKDARECTLPMTKDGNYEIWVSRVGTNGDESIKTILYGRPYTSTHEEVLAFPRLVSKHYFVKNNLVLFFSSWQDEVLYAELRYTKADGTPGLFNLNKQVVESKYMILPDELKPGTPVTLVRRGLMENCPDPIDLNPIELSTSKVYTSDMQTLFEEMYDSEITDELANQTTVVKFNHSVNSFEDILNLPNLRELVLGEERYLPEGATETACMDAKVRDTLRSLFVLETAQKLTGLKIKRYNQHYIPADLQGYEIDITEMGNPQLPELNLKSSQNWSINCSVEDAFGYDSHLEYLIDGDPSTCWMPELQTTARTYEVEIDMKSMQTVEGLLLHQKAFDANDAQSAALIPNIVKVQFSDERKITWTNATYVEDITIGATNGEKVLINLPASQQARYIRVTLYDRVYGSSYSITLGDIGVF